MPDTKTDAGKPYKVLRIDEMTRLGEAGGVEKYYRHQIKTRGGVVLSVDVGEREFTAEKAAPILAARAAEADKIMSL